MISLQTIPQSEVLSYKFVYQQQDPAPMDFTSVTTSQDITLFGMPPNHAVCAVKINPTIAFVGTSLATLTIQIGVSATTNYYAPAFSITQSAAFQVTTPLSMQSSAAHDVVARFIATGASINAITAGQVEITIQIRPLP